MTQKEEKKIRNNYMKSGAYRNDNVENLDYWINLIKDRDTKLIGEIEKIRTQALEEERQFILNILDGIDEADRQMGNKNGGTKAIRLALSARIISLIDEE